MHPSHALFERWTRLTDLYTKLCEQPRGGHSRPDLLRRVAGELTRLDAEVQKASRRQG